MKISPTSILNFLSLIWEQFNKLSAVIVLFLIACYIEPTLIANSLGQFNIYNEIATKAAQWFMTHETPICNTLIGYFFFVALCLIAYTISLKFSSESNKEILEQSLVLVIQIGIFLIIGLEIARALTISSFGILAIGEHYLHTPYSKIVNVLSFIGLALTGMVIVKSVIQLFYIPKNSRVTPTNLHRLRQPTRAEQRIMNTPDDRDKWS